MIKRSAFFCHALLLFLVAIPVGQPAAAEFTIDAQRTILRQLQFCLDCGAALLVTGVHPGVLVRCPDCGKEQPRLSPDHVLTQVYQICSLCQSPLDAHGRHAGEVVECGNCHTRQVLTRDAFPQSSLTAGLGYTPGFPPGSQKKNLLYSSSMPDAPITPVPLETSGPFDPLAAMEPLPPSRSVKLNIPPPELPPPAPVEVAHAPAPALPELPPPAPVEVAHAPAPALPELPPLQQRTTSAPPSGNAVDVPVVTADLFGGSKRQPSSRSRSDGPLSGDIIARVDGSPIYSAEVERIVGPVLRRLREQANPEERAELAGREHELRSQILERLIDRELVMKEAARINHRPDSALVRRREVELSRMVGDTPGVDIRREAERDITMSDMRARFAEKPGSARPEQVREFYRANADKLQQPRLIALTQLAIFADRAGKTDTRPYQEIAADIAARLERGDRFDDLRKQADEFAQAVGLDLPESFLLPESAYASHIVAMAGSLRTGAVFGPIPMSGLILFGKVVDERPAGPIPFEEVEKEIRQRLESEATERNLEQWLKSLRQRSVVELYINE